MSGDNLELYITHFILVYFFNTTLFVFLSEVSISLSPDLSLLPDPRVHRKENFNRSRDKGKTSLSSFSVNEGILEILRTTHAHGLWVMDWTRIHQRRRSLDSPGCATIPQALHCLKYICSPKSPHPKDNPCFAPTAIPSSFQLLLPLHKSERFGAKSEVLWPLFFGRFV